MTRLRGRAATALLTGFGALVGFVVLETGARLAAVVEERRQGRLDRDLTVMKAPAPRSTVTLGQIIRKSENPRIVYELRPRLDVVFAGGRLATSDTGFRGTEVETPKAPSEYRIVGIGDSYMFGQGVSDDETYLARLASAKDELRSGRSTKTVNLAVPGYNTVMEVELLRDRIEALQPDLILIEIVGNDLDLPNFLWNAVDPWTPRRSFLLDFVRGRLAVKPSREATGLAEAPHATDETGETFRRDEAVPPQYASMVGLPAFEAALQDLAELGRKRAVPILALTHGVWFEEDMLKALAKNGIPVLVLRPALRRRARALGAPDYARSPLALSAQDLHPSALGHLAVAEELTAWLKTQLPASPPSPAPQD